MKRVFSALFAVVLLYTACDKEDSDNPSKTEIISQQSWKFDNAGIDVDKNGSIDLPAPSALLQTCITDNTLSFSANGTGTLDEGPTKCDPALPQTIPVTWSFANNETALNVSGGGGTVFSGQFKVLELTNAKLSLSKDTSVALLGPVAFVVNLKH